MLMSHCLFHGTQLKVKMKYTKKCRQFDAVGERAGKEKKKNCHWFLFVCFIYFSANPLSNQNWNSFSYHIPRNESGGLLWAPQSSHTHLDHYSDCCFMCSLTAFICMCLGHLLTTRRHCRNSLDIFTLSKIRTFHTVDTCSTSVTWHWDGSGKASTFGVWQWDNALSIADNLEILGVVRRGLSADQIIAIMPTVHL